MTIRRGVEMIAACALLTPLAGCPIGDSKYPKPSELSQSWFIDKVRLLAVQAEPAEVRPGETASFTALVTNPEGTALTTVWLACPPDPDDPGGIGFGCQIDPTIDFANLDLEALAEAGFIGVEPLFRPTYTAPLDLLDGLDDRARAEGVYVLVQAAILPGDSFTAAPTDTDPAIDFNEVEAGYKRLVVSEATSPNHNPQIAGLSAEGVTFRPGDVLEVDRNQDYAIAMTLADDAIETYDYTDKDGVTTDRTEEPYVHWYTDGGEMTEEITLYPYLEATWRSPPEDDPTTSGTLWAVVRDRRGGMNWTTLAWRIRGSAPPATP